MSIGRSRKASGQDEVSLSCPITTGAFRRDGDTSNIATASPSSRPTLSTFFSSHICRSHVRDDTAGDSIGAARYSYSSMSGVDRQSNNITAKPMTALQPFRLAANAAYISSSSSKPAQPAISKPGLVKGGPPPPPAMKSLKEHREVPLPSQEGTKGVVQYAL